MNSKSQLTTAEALVLEQTLGLAELGRAGARPNPVVGALLARADGTIVSTGYHERYGEFHAERRALDAIDILPSDSVLYVSLEPCAHVGKQPACADLLIERGVRRVVIASPDSNPATAGHGPQRLREAGVRVDWGSSVIARKAIQQNAGFHALHQWKRPYVTYKWAMTRNGRMATGAADQPWISSADSRDLVHYMRAGSGAIAVGIGTVLADDPLLTVRGPMASRMANPPLRVVFDRALRTPLTSTLVATSRDAPVLIIAAPDAPIDRQQLLEQAGVEVWRPQPGSALLESALEELGRRGVGDLLLESGPRLATAFQQAGLIDALTCFLAPTIAPADQPGFARNSPIIAAVRTGQRTQVGPDTAVIRVVHEVAVETL